MDKSYFVENVKEIIEDKKIDLKNITIDDIASISREFFGIIESNDKLFCGIEGYLQNVYACLISKWLEESKKHEGVKCSDVPELISIKNDIEEFKKYTEKFLRFKYTDGTFEAMEGNKY